MRHKLPSVLTLVISCAVSHLVFADPLPPDATYRPLPTQPFSEVKASDEAAKPEVMQRQQELLSRRYDLADRPIPGVMMSAGKKPVQGGVRVKLPAAVTWDSLAAMTSIVASSVNRFTVFSSAGSLSL